MSVCRVNTPPDMQGLGRMFSSISGLNQMRAINSVGTQLISVSQRTQSFVDQTKMTKAVAEYISKLRSYIQRSYSIGEHKMSMHSHSETDETGDCTSAISCSFDPDIMSREVAFVDLCAHKRLGCDGGKRNDGFSAARCECTEYPGFALRTD